MSVDLYEAVVDRLAAVLAVPVADTDPTGLPVPCVYVWGPNSTRDRGSETVGGCSAGRIEMRVTAVGRRAGEARVLAGLVRDELTPGLMPSTFTADGAHVTITHFDSQTVAASRNTVEEATDSHPVYAVELFDLLIQPLQED